MRLALLSLMVFFLTVSTSTKVDATSKIKTSDSLKLSQMVAARALAADQIKNRVTAENMANTDTPNYVPKDVYMQARREGGRNSPDMVRIQKVQRNPNKTIQVYEPSNPMANEQGMVTKPKLDPLILMTDIQRTRIHSEQMMKSIQVASQMRQNVSKMMNY